jgi:acetyl-CoA acetyltransferase
MSHGRSVSVAGAAVVRPGSGVGSDVESLALGAARAAIADAGLNADDIDGIFEYRFGADSPDCVTLQRMLGIADLAMFADIENTSPSGLAAVAVAAMAVASGACEVALAFRCITKETGNHGRAVDVSGARPPGGRGGSRAQYFEPFGDTRPVNILVPMALRKRRRMAEFGRNLPDEYGHVSLNSRRWGTLNPDAALPQLLTMDDYRSSRRIVEPLLLLDCDVPVSGACAVVVTTSERARDMRSTPVEIEALAYGTGRSPDWTFADDFLFGGTRNCADRLWSRSSLEPGDIDVAEVYDGFTHIAISWIEALGFCGIGEFGDWVDAGRTIGPGGSLPMNTSGGQLSEGRLHGLGLFVEAVRQVRGDATGHQVEGARAAVVGAAFGPQCAAMTLVRGDS